MSVTEVGCMGVKPGLDILDKSTPEGQVLLKIWNTVLSAPGGPHRVYWGTEVEDSSKLWAFFDWDSVEHHQQFAKSYGAEATKDFPQILTHGEFTKHFAFAPPKALKSPVTEVILAYFPSNISADEKNAASSKLQEFVNFLETSNDVQAVNCGWGSENDFPVRGGSEGQKGSVLTALVGWPSTDARSKFQDTQDFQDNEGLLKGMEGMVNLVKLHLKCQSLGRDS